MLVIQTPVFELTFAIDNKAIRWKYTQKTALFKYAMK